MSVCSGPLLPIPAGYNGPVRGALMSRQILPYNVSRDVDIMIEVESFRSQLLEWRLEYAFADWRGRPLPPMPEVPRELSMERSGGERHMEVCQLWCEVTSARSAVEHERFRQKMESGQ